ncbi:MAG TPA: hypothetical protein VGS01_09550 [Candidatus Limnocylindria bacterium]|jgi:hypothetical protein|nr:hypothetical protein [Candidatus Limnocylindria bacterium]
MALVPDRLVVDGVTREEARKHGYEVRLLLRGEVVGGGTIVAPNSVEALAKAREYSRFWQPRTPHDEVAVDRIEYSTTRTTLTTFAPDPSV